MGRLRGVLLGWRIGCIEAEGHRGIYASLIFYAPFLGGAMWWWRQGFLSRIFNHHFEPELTCFPVSHANEHASVGAACSGSRQVPKSQEICLKQLLHQ